MAKKTAKKAAKKTVTLKTNDETVELERARRNASTATSVMPSST